MRGWTETLTALINHARIDELPEPVLIVTHLGVTITGTDTDETRQWADSLTDVTRVTGHDRSLEYHGSLGAGGPRIKVVQPAPCQRALFDEANDPYNHWRNPDGTPVRRDTVPCSCRRCPADGPAHGGVVEAAVGLYGYASNGVGSPV